MVLPTGLRAGLRYTVRSTVDAPEDTDLLDRDRAGRRRGAAIPRAAGPAVLARGVRPPHGGRRADPVREGGGDRGGRPRRARAGRGGAGRVVLCPVGDVPVRRAGRRRRADEGTAEQFASAFAVLARAVGLPTRVVVGFRPVPPGPDGVAVVRGGDATAWPEVYFSGWGWVPFDPVTGHGRRRHVGLPPRGDQPPRHARRPTPSVPGTPGPAIAVEGPRTGRGRRAPAAHREAVVSGVLAVPVLVFGLLGGLRAGRRSRLRRAGATGRVGVRAGLAAAGGPHPGTGRPGAGGRGGAGEPGGPQARGARRPRGVRTGTPATGAGPGRVAVGAEGTRVVAAAGALVSQGFLGGGPAPALAPVASGGQCHVPPGGPCGGIDQRPRR